MGHGEPPVSRSAATQVVILVALLTVVVVLVYAATRVQARENLRVCQSNVEEIKHAIMRYQDDYVYPPERLQDLVPVYMKALPTCPAAGIDTYSPGYTRGNGMHMYFAWFVCCLGEFHVNIGAAPNTPAVQSEEWSSDPRPPGSPNLGPPGVCPKHSSRVDTSPEN